VLALSVIQVIDHHLWSLIWLADVSITSILVMMVSFPKNDDHQQTIVNSDMNFAALLMGMVLLWQ